ncbi:hypothetical protein PV327_005139 [Microctonus hyperodae]|uniref:F-box domain-containing protein n=1 Tax=Microctonus hyperodae TaxID=165561 RepID=A0AA39KZI1_MICHY|nr:hypothetical protein PV327_005139 [Microctonus hyperodae]
MEEIEILNHDVLREIFSYLSFRDQLNVAAVCKKWQYVVDIMMGSIRKMCCLVNKDINCSKLSVQIRKDVVYVTTRYVTFLGKPLKKFGANLTKIQIEDRSCHHYISIFFYELLKNCTKLKHARLIFGHDFGIMENFLKSLPTDNLEHLSIYYTSRSNSCRSSNNNALASVLAKSPKLKSLDLNYTPIQYLESIGGTKTLTALFIAAKKIPRLNFNMKELKNLETLSIHSLGNDRMATEITKLIRNCRKLHSIRFECVDILPETILDEMMSLPNLRRLCLCTSEGSYESWYKFSNLEDIQISQCQPLLTSRDQIKNFLQRSNKLKTYYFPGCGIDHLFLKLVSDLRYECISSCVTEWHHWHSTIPF